MINKIRHIAIYLILFSFTVSVIGVNINLHFCASHKAESISLYNKAECPCEHSHEGLCDCCKQHNDHSRPHEHNMHYSEICDDCCQETEISISISDVFSPSHYKIQPIVFAELYTIPDIDVASQESINKIINIEIAGNNKILIPKVIPITHIYSLSSAEDKPANSIA